MEEAEMVKKPTLRVVKPVKAKKLDMQDLITKFEFEIVRGRAPSLSALYYDSAARQELFERSKDKTTVMAINAYFVATKFDPGNLFDAWERLRDEINAARPELKIRVRKPQLKPKPVPQY